MPSFPKKAAAALALFTSCVASGFAAAPTAQQAQAVAALETPVSSASMAMNQMASALMVNTQDALIAQDLAPRANMVTPLFQMRMSQVVGKLAIHLSKEEQTAALNSMLTASFVGVKEAKATLSKLPKNNVVHELLTSTFETSEAIGAPVEWSSLSSAVSHQLPNVNIRDLSLSEGVHAVKTVLNQSCGSIPTSMSIGATNLQCAAGLSTASQKLARGLNDNDIRDGYLVGEFDSVPVVVSQSGALANGLASLLLLYLEKEQVPIIAISSDLANAIAKSGNMDTMRLILAHEYGHLKEYNANGTMLNTKQSFQGQIHDELVADHHAMEALTKMGISQENIAAAFDALTTAITDVLGPAAEQNPFLQDMFQQRTRQMHQGHSHSHSETLSLN